jgi:putative iron-regulated protein
MTWTGWRSSGPRAAKAARRWSTAAPQGVHPAILTGMGSLSYGELAGERMKLGLMLHDPEEEHDCFSDNTHFSHYYDAMGIRNVYTGSYVRVDGSRLSGPSIAELVAAKSPDADKALRKGLDATLARMQVLVDSAEKKGVHYDQLIGEGNKEGNAMVMAAIDALLDQTKLIEKAVTALDISADRVRGLRQSGQSGDNRAVIPSSLTWAGHRGRPMPFRSGDIR